MSISCFSWKIWISYHLNIFIMSIDIYKNYENEQYTHLNERHRVSTNEVQCRLLTRSQSSQASLQPASVPNSSCQLPEDRRAQALDTETRELAAFWAQSQHARLPLLRPMCTIITALSATHTHWWYYANSHKVKPSCLNGISRQQCKLDPLCELEKLPLVEDQSQTDRVSMPTHAGFGCCHWPWLYQRPGHTDNVTMKTYWYGHQSILMGNHMLQ